VQGGNSDANDAYSNAKRIRYFYKWKSKSPSYKNLNISEGINTSVGEEAKKAVIAQG